MAQQSLPFPEKPSMPPSPGQSGAPAPEGTPTPQRADIGDGAATPPETRAASEADPSAEPEGSRPATLSGCLAGLADLRRAQKRLLPEARTAVSTLARVTGKTPDALPAAPEHLRPIISAVLPAAHGMSWKRWANIKSAITTLLLESGWIAPESRPKAPQGAAWRPVLDLAARDLGTFQHAPLGPFARYCASRGRGPSAVESPDLTAYEQWRTTRTLDMYPRHTAISVSIAWRRLRAAHPELGLHALQLKSRVWRKAMRETEFPAGFQAELAAYLAQMRHPDPLNPDHPRPSRELTVQHARRAILRTATYLVAAGTPASGLVRLAQLVSPDAYRTVLLALHQEFGGQWNDVAANIAGNLLTMARYWVRPGAETISELETLRSLVRPQKSGLSRRVRDRLAQFSTDEARSELFDLPQRGFEAADRMLRDGNPRAAAKQHEAALALAILLAQPIRVGNLAGLDITRHLARDRRHRLQRIVIVAGEVKNRRDIDVILPRELAARIERHISVFRPHVPGHDEGSSLFPGRSGASRKPETIGRVLRRMVERQLGARFNAHLARHLAAEMLMEDDPNNIVVVQRLLGHADPKTTASIYGITRTSAAQGKYAGLVEGLRQREVKRERRKVRRCR